MTESWDATESGGGPARGDSASEPGGTSDARPACGGERPPAATAGSASDSPPQAGPSADRMPDSGEPDPLVVAIRERDEYRDALVHLQADFENYKKRILKQQTEHLERAAESLVDKLLPVLDTADLALAHGGGEDVKQITVALTSALEREGLERIDPTGRPFDPTIHDAVAHEPSEGGEQEVVEVLRAGYRWKGRVLRPAMVKVRG
jgi:molecular chaperone GrpE